MEVDTRTFCNYPFYSYDDNETRRLIGRYNFDDIEESKILKRENQLFEEFKSQLLMEESNEHNTLLPSVKYSNFIVQIASDKILDCEIKGVNVNPRERKKTRVPINEGYLSLKSKSLGNSGNINAIYNFTKEECDKYNLQMLKKEIADTYKLSIKLRTHTTLYHVEIGYSQGNNKGIINNKKYSEWKTWFDVIEGTRGLKELHVGIYFKRINDEDCILLKMDNFM